MLVVLHVESSLELLGKSSIALRPKSNEESEDAAIHVNDAPDSLSKPRRSNCLRMNCVNDGSGFGSIVLRIACVPRRDTTVLSADLNPRVLSHTIKPVFITLVHTACFTMSSSATVSYTPP